MTKLLQALNPHLESKTHVIWDFNGTLLNDVEHTVTTVNSLLAEHELPRITSDDYKKIFDFPVVDYYIKLGFDFKKESFESLCDKFTTRFMGGFKEASGLMPDIELTLSLLKKQVGKQSILSAAEQTSLLHIVDHHNISQHFDYIYGIDTHYADSKIARGKELLKIANHPLNKTVIIGDTIHDLEVGEELGIDVILVAHGHQCSTRLKKHHDTVIEF
ncbi:MAG: HAD family hydrolase [Bdellovibrionales bacterium]|nr:HAD family hydrolase [Bdellovibrionales bacterium]